MKLTGYGSWNFVAEGYHHFFDSPPIPTVSVEPTIINRAGAKAAFGISVVGSGVFSGGIICKPDVDIEEAVLYILKQLNPVSTAPRELRAERNNGLLIKTQAVLQISNVSLTEELNVVNVNFHFVDTDWLGVVATTGSGSFS